MHWFNRDFMGTSAMSLACARGHEAVVRLLLEWGADFSGLCSVGAEWLAYQVRQCSASVQALSSPNAWTSISFARITPNVGLTCTGASVVVSAAQQNACWIRHRDYWRCACWF